MEPGRVCYCSSSPHPPPRIVLHDNTTRILLSIHFLISKNILSGRCMRHYRLRDPVKRLARLRQHSSLLDHLLQVFPALQDGLDRFMLSTNPFSVNILSWLKPSKSIERRERTTTIFVSSNSSCTRIMGSISRGFWYAARYSLVSEKEVEEMENGFARGEDEEDEEGIWEVKEARRCVRRVYAGRRGYSSSVIATAVQIKHEQEIAQVTS